MENLRREEHHTSAMIAGAGGLAVGVGLPSVPPDQSW
jgi:hypothetical protein